MAISVVMNRKVIQGWQAKELIPIVIKPGNCFKEIGGTK